MRFPHTCEGQQPVKAQEEYHKDFNPHKTIAVSEIRFRKRPSEKKLDQIKKKKMVDWISAVPNMSIRSHSLSVTAGCYHRNLDGCYRFHTVPYKQPFNRSGLYRWPLDHTIPLPYRTVPCQSGRWFRSASYVY